ncbi:MAG: VCBS repeat-containing protein [Blastocatellia bacterium]
MKAKTVFQKTSEGLGAQRVALLTLFVLVIGGHFLRPHTAQAAWQATACQLPPLQKTGSLAVASATDVIATDFNHDGKQDVLVLRTSPAQSQTYFGDGAGGFTLAASANGFSVLRNDEILVGEFNGDGFPDLYVRRDDGGNNRQVQVYINDGQGRFTLGAEITARVLSFLIGDVNNDGLDDVLAATSSNYTVYLANANRTFTRLPNDFGSGQSALLLDLNGDGRLDFVNVIRGAGNVGTMFIWQGNGNGTFQQMDFLSLADYVQLRKAADLNRDGRADIVATTTCSGTGTPKLYHLLNNGRGNFTARSFDLPGAPCDVAVKGVQDFTSDGFPEVALSNRRIALNDGQGGVCSPERSVLQQRFPADN